MRQTSANTATLTACISLLVLYGCGSDGASSPGAQQGQAGTAGMPTAGATATAGSSSAAGTSTSGAGTAALGGSAGSAGTASGSGGTSSVGGSDTAGSGGVAAGGSTGTTGGFNEGTELKAFPTAEGYGRNAKGGRGGKVIEVTNLNDSGPGSLRAAIMATGPRTVVFTVSGAIELKSKIQINDTNGNSEVTVAGQTAPGKGIQIRNYSFGMTGGHDVIMRFVRVGIGGASQTAMDGMGARSANNAIFDHCSVNWTIDEAFSSRLALNITLQRSILSECLNESYHYDDSTADHTGTQPHGFAASISGGKGSFHHNLLAHCAGRNWSLAGAMSKDGKQLTGELDIRNNVVYNWIDRTTDGENHQLNFVNNYYKPGPSSKRFQVLRLEYYEWVPDQASWFISGNVMPGHLTASDVSKSYDWGDAVQSSWIKSSELFPSYVTTQSAEDGYTNVLANVGANVPVLDDHDKRIINEVKDGTYKYKGSKGGHPGIIDDEADAGGFESVPKETRPADWDTDHDGIPGAWETAHGLNPADAADGNKTNLSKLGYTNLEMYLNELAGDFK